MLRVRRVRRHTTHLAAHQGLALPCGEPSHPSRVLAANKALVPRACLAKDDEAQSKLDLHDARDGGRLALVGAINLAVGAVVHESEDAREDRVLLTQRVLVHIVVALPVARLDVFNRVPAAWLDERPQPEEREPLVRRNVRAVVDDEVEAISAKALGQLCEVKLALLWSPTTMCVRVSGDDLNSSSQPDRPRFWPYATP